MTGTHPLPSVLGVPAWSGMHRCGSVAGTASLGGVPMMGYKDRTFAPLVGVSLETLVPKDHVYRHLEQQLDLSFVRELVAPKVLVLANRMVSRSSLASCVSIAVGV